MRYRSYEFYEIWRNLGQNNEDRVKRYSRFESADKEFSAMLEKTDLYLIRINVIAVKKDEPSD